MAYTRVNWEDSPSSNTPVNAANLNIMDAAIKSVSDATDTTVTNPASQTSYYPTFVSSLSGKATQRVNNGLRYDTLEGTTSTPGRSTLVLGNATASGTAGNKEGRIALHNSNTGYTWIQGTSSTSSFTQTLPALTGTFVVKQSTTISTETNGWYKVNMGAFTLYFKNSTIASATYGANDWGAKHFNLPSGVTFNTAKMCFSGSATGTDRALRTTISVSNGATQTDVAFHNAYNNSITTTIVYNAMLIDFS